MNIVICEDNADYRNFINDVLTDYINQYKLNANVVLCTDNTFDICTYIKKNSEVTIYYLDIKLNEEITGFNLASEIRKRDYLSHIIFITNYRDLMPITFLYKLEALDYIVKDHVDDVKKKLCEGLAFAEKRQHVGYEKCLNIQNKQKNFSIPLNQICYIESIKSSHKLILYYDHGAITFYGQLQDIKEQLGSNFIRCHRSIIVNKDKILSVDKQNYILELTAGYSCVYSRKCKEVTSK